MRNSFGVIRRKRLPNLHQLIQYQYRHIASPSSPLSLSPNLQPTRSSERIPQKLYEQHTKYCKFSISIQPRVSNLSVYTRLANEGKFKTVINTDVPNIQRISGTKLLHLLEPITFHMCLVMRQSSNQSEVDQKLQPQQEFFTKIIEILAHGKSIRDVKSELQENNVNIDKDIQFLKRDKNVTLCKALELGIIAFYLVCKRLQNSYTVHDFYNWILAISEDSIISSHSRISNLQDVPIFVLFDILLRNPMFKEEYILQTEIWKRNIKPISVYCIANVSILKEVFDNLIYYGLVFEPSYISPILKGSLGFYNSTRTGVNIKLGNDFLNDLVWNVAFYASRYRYLNPILVAGIQELLLKYYSRSKKTIHEELSFKAYIGLVLMISRVSQEKAETLFKVAEEKFLSHGVSVSKKDMVAYHIGKIWLANTPEEVVHFFNEALREYERSSKLWLFMIRKLNSMGLFDEKRSLIILAKIVDTGIIIPKDIVTELLHPVHDLLMLEEMYKLLTNRKTNKKNWTSSLLPKYISLLYRNNHDVMRLPQTVFPWDHGIQNQEGKYKGFDSTAEYARYLYWNHVPTKSIYYIGLMLEGEAKANHKNVFSLYKSELLDKNLSPNIQCLGVLLQVATKLGTTQVWNGLTPPQVATNQFQTHVKADANDFGIMPDDLLWKKYIELLSKYQYISEVSKIMKWWEDLKYNPPKDVLVVLLSALPEEYAKRHIEHISKLKRETKTVAKPNWEWPTYEEYEDYKSRNRV